MMKRPIACILFLFLASCASKQPKPEPRSAQPQEGEASRIDVEGLQRSLGMDTGPEDLGYRETAFDTCTVGHGYSSTHDCAKKHFATVTFRLQCRDTEGTISTGLTAADLTAIAGKKVRWALSGEGGSVQTDGDGFGQISAIFSGSPKKQRLRIAVDDQFLYMRAGEITRVVVPRQWCD